MAQKIYLYISDFIEWSELLTVFGEIGVAHLVSFLDCVLFCLFSSHVLFAHCCQCPWIVYLLLHFRFSLTCIKLNLQWKCLCKIICPKLKRRFVSPEHVSCVSNVASVSGLFFFLFPLQLSLTFIYCNCTFAKIINHVSIIIFKTITNNNKPFVDHSYTQ